MTLWSSPFSAQRWISSAHSTWWSSSQNKSIFPSKKHTNLHHWPAPNGKGVLSNKNSSHALTKLTLASCGRIPPSTVFGSTVHLFVCVCKSDWKAFNFVWAKIDITDITPFDMICQPSVWLLPWDESMMNPWSWMAFDAFACWAPGIKNHLRSYREAPGSATTGLTHLVNPWIQTKLREAKVDVPKTASWAMGPWAMLDE